MDYEQQGVFNFLLDQQWLNGSLPADLEEVRSILHLDTERFERVWKRVAPCFELIDGRLVNPRLAREREKREAYCESRAENGKRGGRPSKEKHTETICLANGKAKKSFPVSCFQFPKKTSPLESQKKKVFSAPDSSEVLAFFAEKKSDQGEAFFDHFTANGWVQGKARAPIKDWRAAARNWIRRAPEFTNGTAKVQDKASILAELERRDRERAKSIGN